MIVSVPNHEKCVSFLVISMGSQREHAIAQCQAQWGPCVNGS